MKFLKLIAFIAAATLGLCACSDNGSDDPNIGGNITLPEGQSTHVSYYSNSGDGAVEFYAAADWYAYKDGVAPSDSYGARASEGDIDWLVITNDRGAAGSAKLTFTLESNLTGNDRSAYIIVYCDGETTSFKVTQSANNDPD